MKYNFSVLRLFAAVFLLVLFVILSGSLYAATYYVSKEGNDSNPGTIEKPWRTIAKANSTLNGGDTVYIRGGQYQEVIKPARSGDKGAYIVYSGYSDENPVFTNINTAVDLANRSYIKVESLKVDGNKLEPDGNIQYWVRISNGHHNIIQNCEMQYAMAWEGIRLNDGASFNRILNNVLDGFGDLSVLHAGDMIYIEIDSHNNLVEGNKLTRGGHNLLDVRGSNNVIRGNFFNNQFTSEFGYRSVTISSHAVGLGRNVFEDNILFSSKDIVDEKRGYGAMSMKAEGDGQIVRRNFIFENAGVSLSGATRQPKTLNLNNKIYHNTIYNNGGAAWEIREYIDGGAVSNNIFKNNIVYRNHLKPSSSWDDNDLNLILQSSMAGNKIISNAIVGSVAGDAIIYLQFIGKGVPLSTAESMYPKNIFGNLQAEPKFVDSIPTKKEDFKLRSDSQLIDAGAFLTFAVGGGSGDTIKVDDAGYFSDGFGLVEGDLVQVGSNRAIEASKIDYSSNQITLSQSISWMDGDGVSLPYNGKRPDIGAIESEMLPPALSPPPTPLAPPMAPEHLDVEVITE